MKKLSLLFLGCVFIFAATAQEKKWFIGAGVQGNVYVNNMTSDMTGGGNVFVGKWFSPKVGARISVEFGQLNPEFKNVTAKEAYVGERVDLMLNLTEFFSANSNRVYNLIPYIGLGAGHAFNGEKRPDNAENSNSFMFGGGLLNTFRLSNDISAFINLGANFLDAKFDGYKSKSLNGLFSPSLGITYNF